MIDIISVGSSSSGNSYIIKAGGRAIILDVGLTAKRITEALAENGIEPEDVEAVLITHEHTDHVKSVRAISRKCCNAVFYATRGTVSGAQNFTYVPEERLHIVRAGDTVMLESRAASAEEPADGENEASPVRIDVFAISHDAREPVSYSVTCGGEKLSVVTDTGVVTEEIYEAIKDADKLVFESNHDEGLLMYGEYPYPLKVRIKSDHGHLSNRSAGETLARLMEERRGGMPPDKSEGCRPLEIMLAHLSFHNNAPYYARTTIEPILSESGFERDVDYTLTIAAKDDITVF